MPDAIVDAVYWDHTVSQHCTCSSIHDEDNGPVVVLHYVESDSMVTVPFESFKQTESIEVRQLPGEQ